MSGTRSNESRHRALLSRNVRALAATLAFGSAIALGCYTGPAVDPNRSPNGPTVDQDMTEPGKGGPIDKDGGTHTPRGLPCDVAAFLATNCIECHGAVPSGGAQNRLLSYADFTRKASSPDYENEAASSLARIKSMLRPMPPGRKLADSAVSVFERWVKAGLPKGTCGEDTAAGPGASRDSGTDEPDSGEPPPEPTSVCTSGAQADPEAYSDLMRPGQNCIGCHASMNGPTFQAAGTVYPTAHEPNDCHGSETVTVVVIDANGRVHSARTNEAGNFYLMNAIPKPYRALVARGTELREMQTPQTDGDCNSCHTEWGQGAPGRIHIP